jgi:hypothetical protein
VLQHEYRNIGTLTLIIFYFVFPQIAIVGGITFLNQLMIYDYLGVESDPIYQKLKLLKKGQKVKLDSLTISLNNSGIYEIKSVNLHDGCYNYLQKILSVDNHVCTI